jgi:GH43 family beta-xylosidase
VNDPGTRRIARVEKITWDENDYPIFPRPSGDTRELQLPSGQIMETYEGTVLDTLSADPASILINGFYYLTLSTDTERQITVHKSSKLTDFRDAEKSVIYQTSAEYENAWASELHMVDGGLYLYFTQNRVGEEHRMYVMKAVDPTNPMGAWGLPTRLFPEQEIFSIDGSILNYDEKIYYVFCSVDEGVPMSIYIAPMSDPMTISGPRVLLRSPHSEWDTHRGARQIVEGPLVERKLGEKSRRIDKWSKYKSCRIKLVEIYF